MVISKPCALCGRPLFKRYKNSAAEWAARKFCSRKCSAQTSPRERTPARIRLAARTDKAPGLGPHGNCWEWTGYRTPDGYGRMKDDRGKHTGAHRVAYEVANGQEPSNRSVLHRCDHPPCVNPAHLFLGGQLENMQDMSAKGRAARGERNFLAKLTAEQVRKIRIDDSPNAEIARYYGVDASTVSRIRAGIRWTHISQ